MRVDGKAGLGCDRQIAEIGRSRQVERDDEIDGSFDMCVRERAELDLLAAEIADEAEIGGLVLQDRLRHVPHAPPPRIFQEGEFVAEPLALVGMVVLHDDHGAVIENGAVDGIVAPAAQAVERPDRAEPGAVDETLRGLDERAIGRRHSEQGERWRFRATTNRLRSLPPPT